jgi:hypothetical protein
MEVVIRPQILWTCTEDAIVYIKWSPNAAEFSNTVLYSWNVSEEENVHRNLLSTIH